MEGSGLRWRGAIAGGERSLVEGSGLRWRVVEGSGLRWRGAIAGEGSDRWWREAVSDGGERDRW